RWRTHYAPTGRSHPSPPTSERTTSSAPTETLPAPWPTPPTTHRHRHRHDSRSRVRGGASRRSHVNPRSVVASPAPTTPSSLRVVASRARTSAPHPSRSQQPDSEHDSSQPTHRRTRNEHTDDHPRHHLYPR